MKKLVLLLMVALFATSGVFAQQRQRERPNSEDMAKRQTETLTKELSLTDAQKEKVYSIVLKFAKSQPQRQQGDNTDREKRREEFQKIQKQRNDSIKTILTDDQKKKFDKHLEDMQSKMRQNRRSQQ